MIYEVRFQTVAPERRAEYLKIYKEAIQGCKEAGCRRGEILCSEDDPSRVVVLLEWPTKEHHLNSRHADPQKLPRGRRRVADYTQRRRLLRGGNYLARFFPTRSDRRGYFCGRSAVRTGLA